MNLTRRKTARALFGAALATLSLAAAKRGPSSARQSGRKPIGSRTTINSPCAESKTILYEPSNREAR